MPIDYSKWDHLDEYSSDEGEGNNDNVKTPQVTHLDAPSRVTFGGTGVATVEPQPTSPTNAAKVASSAPATKDQPESLDASKVSKSTVHPWTVKGGVVTTPSQRKLYWSQDRYSVSLRLELQLDETVQTVQVDGMVPYVDRHCATGTTKPKLVVRGSKNKDATEVVLLEGALPHIVHLAQDDEDIDWSIERDSAHKVVLISLFKAVPMQGVFVWWKRPLMEFPEIQIESSKGQSNASQEFLSAWEEAHRQFREKRSGN